MSIEIKIYNGADELESVDLEKGESDCDNCYFDDIDLDCPEELDCEGVIWKRKAEATPGLESSKQGAHEYYVVKSWRRRDFFGIVTDYLNEGWEPVGGVSNSDGIFYQGIKRYK